MKRIILRSITTLLILLLTLGLIYIYNLYNTTLNKYNELSKYASSRAKTITALNAEMLKYKEKSDFINEHIAFVISEQSKVYHTYDCHH